MQTAGPFVFWFTLKVLSANFWSPSPSPNFLCLRALNTSSQSSYSTLIWIKLFWLHQIGYGTLQHKIDSELWDFFAWYFHDKAAKLKHSFEVFRFWHFHFHEKVLHFHPNAGSTLLAVEVEGVTTTFSSVTTTCALNLLRLSSPLPSSPHPHSWKLLEFSFYAENIFSLKFSW